MILETALILGGAVALIAVQPPLMRLFPPKPKKTHWEEFWSEEAVRERWGGKADIVFPEATYIFDASAPGNTRRVDHSGFTTTKAYEALKTSYVPQMKEHLEAASGILSQFQTQVEANKAQAELDRLTMDRLIAEEKAKRLAAKPKVITPEVRDITGTTKSERHAMAQVMIDEYRRLESPRSQQSTPYPLPANAEQWDSSGIGRAAFSRKAQELGMQVYLDHATNQYRMRETQLSKNLAALKAATPKWEYDAPRNRWRFGTQIENRPWITAEQLGNAKTYEDLYQLVAPNFRVPDGTLVSVDGDYAGLTVDGVVGESGGAWLDELEGKMLKMIKADGR